MDEPDMMSFLMCFLITFQEVSQEMDHPIDEGGLEVMTPWRICCVGAPSLWICHFPKDRTLSLI